MKVKTKVMINVSYSNDRKQYVMMDCYFPEDKATTEKGLATAVTNLESFISF